MRDAQGLPRYPNPDSTQADPVETDRDRTRELQQLQRALDQHALVSITDPNGTILYANDHFCDVSGYARDELIGRTHQMLASQTHSRAFWTHFWATIRAGRSWRGEICNRAKSGALFWVAATVTPLMGRDGKPTRYIAIRTDITEQKAAEEALRDARDAADRANRAKSDFLASMSHEIRTPMNGVIGFANLLLETALTEEQKQYAAIIASSGATLMTILDDILDFSKVEAGKLTLEPIPVDLPRLLAESLALMEARAREKQLGLVLHGEPGLPARVLADPGRLRQVLLNLLGNAVKFTERGEVRLRAVRLDDHLRFSVEDTGIGIPADVLPQLFQSFTQADRSTTRRFGGTGLGLAISKRLVQLMKGDIVVESTPGAGSTFHVIVPYVAVPDAPALTPSSSPAAASAQRFDGLRVLVAEDNPANALLTSRLLTKAGCHLDVAGNGELAVAQWGRARYDLVLMDCQMPLMDGFEATRTIRALEAQDPSIGRTRIVALTAGVLTHERDACREAGMDDILSKPLLRAALMACLETASTLRASRAA